MKEITSADNMVKFIERWAVIFVVLALYLFFSFKIIYGLANPDPSLECGTPLFAALISHVFISVIAGLILGLRLIFGKGFNLRTKLIIAGVVVLPVIISFSLF